MLHGSASAAAPVRLRDRTPPTPPHLLGILLPRPRPLVNLLVHLWRPQLAPPLVLLGRRRRAAPARGVAACLLLGGGSPRRQRRLRLLLRLLVILQSRADGQAITCMGDSASASAWLRELEVISQNPDTRM
jgi:hypothetical protein